MLHVTCYKEVEPPVIVDTSPCFPKDYVISEACNMDLVTCYVTCYR
jgi:hypothetical protein